MLYPLDYKVHKDSTRDLLRQMVVPKMATTFPILHVLSKILPLPHLECGWTFTVSTNMAEVMPSNAKTFQTRS